MPWPPALSHRPSPCTPLGPPPPHALPLPRPTPRPASHALLSTRQGASAFNQPLSFDTSKVTDMSRMFWVRYARALCPSLESSPPRAHAACTRPTPYIESPGPHTSPRIACACLPFDSVGRGGLQPAAELRHIQRHEHVPDVPQRSGVQPAAELRHIQRHVHAANVPGALRACRLPPAF